jgi:GT2 family glycosyltransferase
VVKAINENGAEVIYTDEDKFSMKTKRYEYPHFKTDYAPDLLCSHNYITHLFVVKTSIMKEVGGFRSYYDGAQDYDMILRCTEKTDRIYHIPRILYHWRMHANSTAADPSSKMYCYVAGQRAIADHLKRIGIEDARVEMLQTYYGYYHAIYEVKDKPLVSIIIPNKDGRETLERCIRSLYRINAYKNIEIIVVENNSTSKDIFTYYHQLQAEHDNIQIVTWPGKTFNYSAINNYGVTFARGDYLLFLNNDTEMINPDSITEMVGHAERAWTGAVGAKLLYEDDSIQHAGLIIGLGGVANSPFLHVNKMAAGYMMRDLINVNYSAVTAACMMVRKSLFEEAGGFDEDLAVAFNDVDFCLKLRKLGKYNVFNAFSLWHHYESVSRGYEDTPEKKARLQKETDLIKEKWPDIFRNGDPYYNPSFDTVKAFELKKIKN